MTGIDTTTPYIYFLVAIVGGVLSLIFWITVFILMLNGLRALRVYVQLTELRIQRYASQTDGF